jgi:hypothetical protein
MSKATDIIVRIAEILRFGVSNIEKKGVLTTMWF